MMKVGERKGLRTWSIAGNLFKAHTKGEARAQAKAKLGYKDRLPVGMKVREVLTES